MWDEEQIREEEKGEVVSNGQVNELPQASEKNEFRNVGRFDRFFLKVGSILAGIGIILLVDRVVKSPPQVRLLMSLVFMIIFSCVGYTLKYRKQILMNTGSICIFLAACFWWISICSVWGLYYPITSKAYCWLGLICLVGILPLVYFLKDRALALFVAIFFIFWIDLIGGCMREGLLDNQVMVFLLSGILVFEIGRLHQFVSNFRRIGWIYQMVGLNVSILSFFWWWIFPPPIKIISFYNGINPFYSEKFFLLCLFISILTVALAVINILLDKDKFFLIERGISLIFTFFVLFSFNIYPPVWNSNVFLFG